MDSVLFHAFIYLLAAVIAVPLAKRFGLGSVLGYLAAGVLIGPHVFNLVGDQAGHVMHFAEFGVVMMLFLVGLELQPARLWQMRTQLLGLGGLQVLLTAVAITGLGVALGFEARLSLAAGLILAMSSTAIVLQSLQERGLLQTPAGQGSFAVLLFQDIAVIPIFALLPLLALTNSNGAATAASASGMAALPAWQQTGLVVGAVAALIFAGRYLVNPLFRAIARTGLREVFTAAALLLVVGISLVMQRLGLSAALGTFMAGVVLANSEYRHELEADIEPFKGLLLGLFFITVGANMDLALLRAQPGTIAGLVCALLAIKFAVLFALSRVFKLTTPEGLLFSFALAQVGEFAFVLLSFAVNHQVLTAAQAAPLVATAALTMAATPLLFVLNEKFVQPRFAHPRRDRPADAIDPAAQENPVIIAGFGRFGHVIGRLLRANSIGTTVLDLDAEQVEIIRRLGIKVFYGDATRLELLHAAGAARAKIIVIAIDEEKKAIALLETVQKNFPHLKIFARAVGRVHAYEYQKRGVQTFYRETLGSSLDLGVDLMQALGMRRMQARRAALLFKRHDEQSMRELAQFWEDDEAYFKNARQHIEAFEQMFASDAPMVKPAPTERTER